MSLKLNGKDKLEETHHYDDDDRADSWVGYFSTYDKSIIFYLQRSEQFPDEDDIIDNPEYCGCVNFEMYLIRKPRGYSKPYKSSRHGGYFLYNKDTTFSELCDFITQDTGYVIDRKMLGTEKEKLDDMEDW